MPCCLVATLCFFGPRVVLFFIWLFKHEWFNVYGSWIIPLIGFFVMPLTTLAYMTGNTFLIVLAVILDISTWGGASKTKSK